MDLSKIKHLMKQNGDRFILVENGEPEMVVMSFREYQKLQAQTANIRMDSDFSARRDGHVEVGIDEVHETEFLLPEAHSGRAEPRGIGEAHGLPVRLEDIRLEDLPI